MSAPARFAAFFPLSLVVAGDFFICPDTEHEQCPGVVARGR